MDISKQSITAVCTGRHQGKGEIVLKRLIMMGLVLLALAHNALAAPVVSITAPTKNTVYLPPATFDISANATDASDTITQVDFYNGTTLLGTATAAPYTFSWSNVASGTYSLIAKATNSHGIVKASAAVKVIVNTPPTVALTAPNNNATYAGLAIINLAANAADSDGTIAKVQFYRANTLIGTVTSPPYTFAWNGVAPGSYSITAKATDDAGAVVTSNAAAVTVTNPVIASWNAPATNTKYAPPATIALQVNAVSKTCGECSNPVARVDFYNGTTLIGTATDGSADSPYTFSWTNVPSGKYRITATATDNQGISNAAGAISVTVNTPPTVNVTAPAVNATYMAPATINVAADVVDIDGSITKVQFYHGNTLIDTVTAPPYNVTWTNAQPGNYNITAKATDNLGSVVTSAALAVTVTNPITVTLSTPLNKARFIPPAVIDIAANASTVDGSTITQVDFYSGTDWIGNATAPPYTVSWSSVPAGKYSITAKATASQGVTNTTSAAQVVVDTSPNVVLTSPANNASYASTVSIPFAANVSDSDGTITKVSFYNGSTLLTTLTSPPYTYTWSGFAVGKYTLRAKATDNLGIVTTSVPAVVTVVTDTPPTVTLTATPTSGAIPATIGLTATAAASQSIAKVEFFDGDTLLATVTQAPYVYNWANSFAGSYSVTATVTDNLGVATVSNAVTVTLVNSTENAYYIHTDQLNTPRVITDEASHTVWQWDASEAFGNNMANQDPGNTKNEFQFNLRFAGQYFDQETGLHYNYFRNYDPSTGRYVESDPIGLKGGINTYGYVGGNPTGNVDSIGLIAGWDQPNFPPTNAANLPNIPNPNGIVPGGPWTPNDGAGVRPGNFQGPKPPKGGRAQCQWVPAEKNGGPPGSNGYWKTNDAGQQGWSRFDQSGNPITPEQAHPKPVTPPVIQPETPVVPEEVIPDFIPPEVPIIEIL